MSNYKSKIMILNPSDNAGILLEKSGNIPSGHKIAIKDIRKGRSIIKYGQPIGLAKTNIKSGQHLHVNNIVYSDKISFSNKPAESSVNLMKSPLPSSFMGYPRRDGRAGTRNYIAIISTVNCSATVTKEIARYFECTRFGKGIDGVIPVIHSEGCAQGIGGLSYELLNRTLAGWLDHPNVVGAVVIGLGCEGTTLKSIYAHLNSKNRLDRSYVESFNIQAVGGTKKAVKAGIEKVNRLISRLPVFRRKETPVSKLTVALNCGGSDAYSSITANPALGFAADMLVSLGGTVVMGETPECFGAEKHLSCRCSSKADRSKLHKIFAWWDRHVKFNDITMNDNLSPGNIAGGISTILEKSLGAITKGGSSPIRQVLYYSERITGNGLIFMDTPGFDPVSVTGLVAGGCNLVSFTTGLGSVYGCSIVPTIKISSNTHIFKKLNDDIDIDAGKVISGVNIDKVAREIYGSLINAASGSRTKSENNNLGREEFAPWQAGETL